MGRCDDDDEKHAVGDDAMHGDELGNSEGGRVRVCDQNNSNLEEVVVVDDDDSVPVSEEDKNNVVNERVVDSGCNFSKRRRGGGGTIGKKKKEKENKEELNVTESIGDDRVVEFSVGDFVWGKVKSHPWWPGRVFDPLDASEYASTLKRNDGHVLVGYFGDHTFAWCSPDQLKPFVEHFEELSRKSGLKAFANAVEAALDEFGRVVELEMACACVSLNNERARQLVVNAGIKEGTCILQGGLGKFSAAQIQPAEIVARLMDVACSVSFTSNLLHLTVLRGFLSALYRFKGCYSLQEYHEAEAIGDLVENVEPQKEATEPGPFKEDGIWSPGGDNIGLGIPNLMKRRKQKMIADIMRMETGNSRKSCEEDSDEEETHSGKDIMAPRKRRKAEGDDHIPGDDSLSSHIQRKSARGHQGSHVVSEDHVSTFKKDGILENSDNTLAPENLEASPRFEHDLVSSGTAGSSQSSRERKKSKYLSPPYTNLQAAQRGSPRRGLDSAAFEFPNTAKMGERMARAASQLTISPTQKHSGLAEVDVENHEPIFSDPQTDEGVSKPKTPETSEVLSSIKLLSEIRSAAVDPVSSRSIGCFDTIKEFISSHRSANYMQETSCNQLQSQEMASLSQRKRKGSELKRDSAAMNGKIEPKKKKKIDFSVKGDTDMAKTTHSPGVLLLSFPLEFALPSKGDLTKIYNKFGELNESKTKVLKKSSSAEVFFVKGSDAEEALSCSLKNSPFGVAKVVYKLNHVEPKSMVKKADDNGDASKYMRKLKSSAELVTSEAANGEASGLNFVKKKLKEISSIMAEKGSTLSSDMLSNLVTEMKGLLRKLKE